MGEDNGIRTDEGRTDGRTDGRIDRQMDSWDEENDGQIARIDGVVIGTAKRSQKKDLRYFRI